MQILDMNPDDEPEDDGGALDLDSHRKGKCVADAPRPIGATTPFPAPSAIAATHSLTRRRGLKISGFHPSVDASPAGLAGGRCTAFQRVVLCCNVNLLHANATVGVW
jgi:hypothetical protein